MYRIFSPVHPPPPPTKQLLNAPFSTLVLMWDLRNNSGDVMLQFLPESRRVGLWRYCHTWSWFSQRELWEQTEQFLGASSCSLDSAWDSIPPAYILPSHKPIHMITKLKFSFSQKSLLRTKNKSTDSSLSFPSCLYTYSALLRSTS